MHEPVSACEQTLKAGLTVLQPGQPASGYSLSPVFFFISKGTENLSDFGLLLRWASHFICLLF